MDWESERELDGIGEWIKIDEGGDGEVRRDVIWVWNGLAIPS